MRRLMMVTVSLLLFALPSCSNSSSEPEATPPAVTEYVTTEELLDKIEAYTTPPQPAEEYAPVTDGNGLPLELVNRLGEAVDRDQGDAVVADLNDESLMITKDKFLELGDGPDHQLSDYLLHRNLSDHLFYRCDTDGDGEDEIFAVPIYRDSAERITMFVKSGDSYVPEGFREIGVAKQCAVFQYQGNFYAAVSCENGKYLDEDTVKLYRMNRDDFCLDRRHEHICLRKKTDIADFHLLYKNDGFAAVGEIQTYVDEISRDLSEHINGYGMFLGDETEREDLREAWFQQGLNLINVYAIDADNDGQDEYFERVGYYYSGNQIGRQVSWYNEDLVETLSPFATWNAARYQVKQLWFKKFDGRTIIFTASQKLGTEDRFLLDIRVNEGGRTTPLLNYIVVLKKSGVEPVLSEQMPYSSTTEYFPLDGECHDPDYEKAFPGDLEEAAASFRAEVGEPFALEGQCEEAFPMVLADLMRETLSYGSLDYIIDGYSRKIDKDEFRERYEGSLEEAEGVWFDEDEKYVYEYRLGRDTYYLLPFYNYWDSLYLFVYKEVDGTLTFCNRFSSPYFGAIVTVYDGELYLMEQPVTSEPEYLWNVYVHKLAPEQDDEYATVSVSLKDHIWKQLYGSGTPDETAVTAYVDSIRDTLLYPAAYDCGNETYTGDESADFDRNLQQRLMSCTGRKEFYEIDFNNDSLPEYFLKMRESRRVLYYNVYHIQDKKTQLINYDLNSDRDHLMQLWFKEIEGKIYTCKLFYYDQYYIFNVSLVEGTDITQVQSYMIMPGREFLVVPGRVEPPQ